LFAGTGSLGIESLSRECSLVYFVDKSFESIRLIEYNIRSLKISNEKYKIVRRNVLDFLRFYEGLKWDIIFLDPPFKIESDIMVKIFEMIADKKISKKNTLAVYEYFFKRDIAKEIKKFRIIKKSNFGDKEVIYLSPLF
jgi:16S rRNA (guanine966-N2)-methyltransferase